MQARMHEGKYANLERELGAILKAVHYDDARSAGYNRVKLTVIFNDAISIKCKLPKHVSVASSLKLSESATKELQELYNNVIEPLNVCLFAVRSLDGDLAMLRKLDNDAGIRMEFERDALADKLTKVVSDRFKNENLDSAPSVKAAIVYPLLIAVLNTWRQTSPEFAGKLIDSIKSMEPDKTLKGIIERIDSTPLSKAS
jgi:hypothetical protein